MFQLLVAVLALFIVILICLATLYFGGSVFSHSGEKATFDRYMAQGVQIQGSMKLADVDLANITGTSSQIFQTLQDKNYLASKPDSGWVIQDSVIYHPLTDVQQCARMNQFAGKNMTDTSVVGSDGSTIVSTEGCPPCSEAAFNGYPACQSQAVIDGNGGASAGSATSH